MNYDYLIVGSGFFGSICAYELNKIGKKVLVIDSRNHIGGNVYTEKKDNINIHTYGPHIFHTSNEDVWKWINQFTEFNNFRLNVVANYKNEIYSLPFNMWTFSKIWGIKTPDEAKKIIEEQSSHIIEPKNLEEQAIKLVGTDIYEKLIKGYTKKQWKKDPKDLPKEIIKRLPVRFTYDNNYFFDKYQGIPIGGYTQIFDKMLEGTEVWLNKDYFDDKDFYDGLADKIIYTGPIDKFFDYQFGRLEYRSLEWETLKLDNDNFQGNPVINYTDIEIPYTRIIEHKWFDNQNQKGTVISYEYPKDYNGHNEPYYPVRDEENIKTYEKYHELTKSLKTHIFGGRLATYVYYDMHQIIASIFICQF